MQQEPEHSAIKFDVLTPIGNCTYASPILLVPAKVNVPIWLHPALDM